jgi:hypothetical protein
MKLDIAPWTTLSNQVTRGTLPDSDAAIIVRNAASVMNGDVPINRSKHNHPKNIDQPSFKAK